VQSDAAWLYAALPRHPEIAMPPVKEIRYFYDCAAYPGETLLQRFQLAQGPTSSAALFHARSEQGRCSSLSTGCRRTTGANLISCARAFC
jgi:hypothetical protein